MKKVLVILALLAVTGIASADLLSNGDFSLGFEKPAPEAPGNTLGAVDWNQWQNGWSNREVNGNGLPDPATNYHLAVGNAGGINSGAWQSVLVPDDGATYKLSADAMLDNWWSPSAYVKIEFYDGGGTQLSFSETWFHAEGWDGAVNQPWANRSVIATAPAGTASITAVLGAWTSGNDGDGPGNGGGTARFDNAVLEVVPEPATMALLGLGALVLRRRK